MDFSDNKKTRRLICLALALVTVGIYWQVHGFDFVDYDDPDYVSENPMVRMGLTFKGIIWAFTHFYASNWHPLTWISHMIDCQLFGVSASASHVVNVMLHAANVILLFLLLHRLTGALWRSAIVAGIFAWHPLHVESVAWIAERKDVLSTFFGLLSLLAYVRYVNDSKIAGSKFKLAYFLALIFFACSLLAKSMLVTLPCVMLLLDFWPLQRVENAGIRTPFTSQFGRLIMEKAPWFALSFAVSILTYFAQKTGGSVLSVKHFSLPWRFCNAIQSYGEYTQKTFWPTHLAVFYPMELVRPVVPFIVDVVILLIITVVAVAAVKRRPFILVGWLWFLGTLVPVIGLVQVGSQSMADRYSYFPMIGVLIAVVWSAHAISATMPRQTLAGGIVAAGILGVLVTLTFFQIRNWKNSVTLFSHALNVTTANTTALVNLGVAFYDAGRDEDALKMYLLARDQDPAAGVIYKNIGLVLAKEGKPEAALTNYQEAVRLNPENANFQNFLGFTLSASGKKEESVTPYLAAVRLEPANAQYQTDLAVALVAAGKKADALPYYQQAARLEPSNAKYQNNFATALARTGELEAAFRYYRAAIADDPDFAEAHSNLGGLLAARRELSEAAAQYAEALRLSPTNAAIHFNAGIVLGKLGRTDEAITQFKEAARLRPDWPEPLNAAAWALATSDNEKFRNGTEAVKLAEKATDLSGRQQPAMLNTLAAAYAEAGRFDDATAAANQALGLAQRAGHTNLISKIEEAITLYKSHAPLREKPPSN